MRIFFWQIIINSFYLVGKKKARYGKEIMAFKNVLCDIEGTTTSITFVKDILFPYASANVEKFLTKITSENRTFVQQQLLDDLINTSNECASHCIELEKIEPNNYDNSMVVKLVKNIQIWIKQDKKYTSLKALQGVIWEDGYESGQLISDVYPDVTKFFDKLVSQGKKIYIYSSGSIKAQQLLFAHTNHGDMTKYISGYFDTNIGPKTEPESYRKIVQSIGVKPEDVFFLTDIEKEAYAADSAGLQARLTLRKGNAPLSEDAAKKFQTLKSFDEIF